MTSKDKVYAMLDKVSPGWRDRRSAKQTDDTNAALRRRGVVSGTVVFQETQTKQQLAALPF